MSSSLTLRIRLSLVSGFLASSTQQIHSLRASGVRPSHSSSTAPSATRAFLKSGGSSCTTPADIFFSDMAYADSPPEFSPTLKRTISAISFSGKGLSNGNLTDPLACS